MAIFHRRAQGAEADRRTPSLLSQKFFGKYEIEYTKYNPFPK
jgi:hypothetical protein